MCVYAVGACLPGVSCVCLWEGIQREGCECVCACIHTCIHHGPACMHTSRTVMHACMHAYTLIYISIRFHTYITDTQAHTQTCIHHRHTTTQVFAIAVYNVSVYVTSSYTYVTSSYTYKYSQSLCKCISRSFSALLGHVLHQ